MEEDMMLTTVLDYRIKGGQGDSFIRYSMQLTVCHRRKNS